MRSNGFEFYIGFRFVWGFVLGRGVCIIFGFGNLWDLYFGELGGYRKLRFYFKGCMDKFIFYVLV